MRSGVGVLIPLEFISTPRLSPSQLKKLLVSLKIREGRIRFIPKSNFNITHFPLFFTFSNLIYMFAAWRVYPSAEKQIKTILCPPMEVYEKAQNFSTYGGRDKAITYLFAKDHLEAFMVDEDMKREYDELVDDEDEEE